MARGVIGSITMGVDPDETHDGTDLWTAQDPR